MKKSNQTYKSIKTSKTNVIEINEVQYKEVVFKEQDKNFIKLWCNFSNIVEDKIKILFYILQNMNNKNLYVIYINDFSKKFNTTRQRISRIIKEYEKSNFIKYKHNIIFVNPEVFFKGSAYNRNKCRNKYMYGDFTQ